MKKITTLLCGIAMAAALSTPVHAGGQSTTGSSATVPASVLAAAQRLTQSRSYFAEDPRFKTAVKVETYMMGSQESIKVTYASGDSIIFTSHTIAYLLANYGG
ncbi:MAG: hypothetical protein R3D46_15695 [Defluviimonas denitrificans]